MADVTITGLPNATTPLDGTERVPMDQAGVTVDATTQDIADLVDAEPAGTAAAAVAAHEAAPDPHPGYLTAAEGDAAYDAIGAAAAAQSAAEATAAGALSSHEAAVDPHPGYAQENALGGAAALNVGTTAGTVAAGDDGRLSDARTPTAHASTHATGQSDALSPADIGAATAAQGSLADSAVQPGDDADTLGSGVATDGWVLTADGVGGAAWEAATGGGASALDDLSDVTITTPANDQVLKYSSGQWINAAAPGGGGGTVTSVGLVAPTGLTVSGSPVTTSGDITLAYDTGYQGFLSADKTKLDGIATGATANSSDATLLNRANHTGTQAGSTVTGLYTASGMTLATNNRLLGRSTAGAGAAQELTVGTGGLTFLQTPSSANLRAFLTDETGSGSAVFATSPTLVTPILGTPTSGTLTNCSGLPVSTGVSGLGANIATALAIAVGSAGAPVINGGVLGTPSSGTLTNCTGLPFTTGISSKPTTLSGYGITDAASNGAVTASGLTMTTARLLGRSTAGTGAIEEITLPAGDVVGTTATQTLTNKTLGDLKETVFTVSDGASVDLDPADGPIQVWTLGADRTPTATSFAAGQSMMLMIADGTAFTITWTTMAVVWVGGSAPTLATSGYTVVELWKMGSTIYGATVGDVA